MKLLSSTFVLTLVLSVPCCLKATTDQQQAENSTRKYHHPRTHHHHNPPEQQQSLELPVQQLSTTHHTRHHHQQNSYHTNNSRKSPEYSVKNQTAVTSNPIWSSTQVEFQLATTSSPPINTKHHHQHNHHQHHHHHHHQQQEQQYAGTQQTEQLESQHATSQQHRNNHHYYQQQQQQQQLQLQQYNSHNQQQQQFFYKGVDSQSALNSIETDAISPQYYKTAHQPNQQRTQQEDYDDYNYGDDDGDDNNHSDMKLNNQRSSFDGAYQDHEHARVTRDHRRLIIDTDTDYQQDQDLSDDEPTRSNPGRMPPPDDNSRPGVLTAHKFLELGNKAAVQQSHDRYLQSLNKSPDALAREHLNRMRTATRCSRPMPRVIYVSNETSKTYMPRGTILHRCGEDTGCCTSTGQVCAVKSYEDVELYFIVIDLSKVGQSVGLTLRNHTECHCVERSNLTDNQRYKRAGDNSNRRQNAQFNMLFSNLDGTETDEEFGVNDASIDDYETEVAASGNAICRCPEYYNIVYEDIQVTATDTALSDQRYNNRPPPPASTPSSTSLSPSVRSNNMNCRCDCLAANVSCQRLKDGKEGFAITDRKCIDERRCLLPACTHGEYRLGRCPRLRNHKRAIKYRDNSYD